VLKTKYWREQMNKFLKDESGATAIEYGLIAAAMGLALIIVIPPLAATMKAKFIELNTGLAAT
jgi:pilus assembly protein Flp/PilA